MATYALRGLDAATINRAKARARERGTSLDDVLRDYLTAYADGETAQQAGGRARAAAMTADERSAQARRAAEARWADRDSA